MHEYKKLIRGMSAERFFGVLVDYLSYPQFVEGCEAVEVFGEEVLYTVSLMGKRVTYRLRHTTKPFQSMEWQCVDSVFLKRNDGAWRLEPQGEDLQICYQVTIDFLLPVPGFIRNRLVGQQLPALIASFEQRARA